MKAVIFDMDGVIVDSEYHWKKLEMDVFSQLIKGWTLKDQQKIIGLNILDIYKYLCKNFGLKISNDEFMAHIDSFAVNIYKEKCQLIDGFLDLAKNLKKQNITIGLASSALIKWINIVVDRFSLSPFFDQIISAENIKGKGKPAPDIYLHTVKQLNIKPMDCIAIEDSKNGVLSAKSAGMYCIGLRNGFNEAQDLSKADIIINGFKEFNITALSANKL